jgi:hypothetical protein
MSYGSFMQHCPKEVLLRCLWQVHDRRRDTGSAVQGVLKRPRLIVGIAIALCASSALAVRLEFTAQYKGRRMPGAEVCFWRAGEGAEPVGLYAQSDDVRCVSADDVLEVPVGRWLYSIRRGSDLVYAQPSVITIASPADEERGYKEVVDELRPAAVLDVSALRATNRTDLLAVYVSNDRAESRPMLMPVGRDKTDAVVPADMPLVVLAIRDGHVVNATDPIALAPAELRKIPPFPAMPAERATVIAWITFPEDARQPGEYWKALGAPEAFLKRSGESSTPALPLFPAYRSDGALLLFRNVAHGRWTLGLKSDVWTPDGLELDVPSGGLIEAPRNLQTRPAAALRVRWSVGAPVAHEPTCAPPATKPAVIRTGAHLLTCEGLQPGVEVSAVNLSRCGDVEVAGSIDTQARVALFSGVRPGIYVAEVREPLMPVRRASVILTMGERASVDLDLRSFDFFGRVTYDGAPFHGRLEFRHGYAISDESGRYEAHLDDDPHDLPVRVVRCDDGQLIHTHLPRRPISRNTPYDLVIVRNEVRVTVTDAGSGDSVAGAVVSCGASTSDDIDRGEFLHGIEATNGEGEAVVANVPNDRKLLICATAERYDETCAEMFTMGQARERTVSLTIRRIVHQGKLIVPWPITSARVYFVAADGRELEHAVIAPDGTFHYRDDHRAPEYVVISGRGMPLGIVSLPETPPSLLEIAPPSLPQQNIDVRIAPQNKQRDGLVGLIVGGRYVPDSAFFDHQSARGHQTIIYGRGPLVIPAVLATGPIDVMLGPEPHGYPREVPPGVDIFTLPAYRAHFPVKRVDAAGKIIFE